MYLSLDSVSMPRCAEGGDTGWASYYTAAFQNCGCHVRIVLVIAGRRGNLFVLTQLGLCCYKIWVLEMKNVSFSLGNVGQEPAHLNGLVSHSFICRAFIQSLFLNAQIREPSTKSTQKQRWWFHWSFNLSYNAICFFNQFCDVSTWCK